MTLNYLDLHLHSKFSRACSKDINLDTLAANAKRKGLTILGTADFTHPLWLKELKKLKELDGIYEYGGIKFIPSTEISLIYKQGGKGRRIHHILLAPDFNIVEQINEFLGKRGRLDYDGRPIFGFSSIELLDAMMSISKDIMVIPSHCMTPWFGIFGSMSGFDSLKECFQERTKHIYAVETGLSADPKMLWRMSDLDKVSLVSFSDAHSANTFRLGRECTAIDLNKIDYSHICDAIKNKKINMTIEFFPEEGKYHFDGHRNCNFSCPPEESKKLNEICPRCGSKLIIGVLNRVEELADRQEGFMPKDAVPYKSLIPLSELIAFVFGTEVFSKRVNEMHNQLIMHFVNEFNVLLDADYEELKRFNEKIADIVIKNREGKLKIVPGYDGVYGKIVLGNNETKGTGMAVKKIKTLKDFS